jgi:hypothetical protein
MHEVDDGDEISHGWMDGWEMQITQNFIGMRCKIAGKHNLVRSDQWHSNI